MYIEDPNLIFTFLSDNTQVTTRSIVKNSIVINEQLYNDLHSSSNTAQLQLKPDDVPTDPLDPTSPTLTEKIMQDNSDIRVVLKDDTDTIFTGIVSNDHTWRVSSTGEDVLQIKIEDVGTRYLNCPYAKEDDTCIRDSLSGIVNTIRVKCKNMFFVNWDSSVTQTLQNKILTNKISSSETCKDILDSICFELGLVYYFDKFGDLTIKKTSLTVPSNIETIASKNDTNTYSHFLYVENKAAIDLTRKARQYSQAKVKFTTLLDKNELAPIYAVTENIQVPGSGWWDGATHDNTTECIYELTLDEFFLSNKNYYTYDSSTNTYVQAQAGIDYHVDDPVPANTYYEYAETASTVDMTDSDMGKEILYVYPSTVTPTESGRTTSMTDYVTKLIADSSKWTIRQHGDTTKLDILIDNTMNQVTSTYTLFSAKARIIRKQGTSNIYRSVVGLTSNSEVQFNYDAEWIHEREDAISLCELLSNYYLYCDNTYTFYCEDDLDLGSIVRVYENLYSDLDVNLLLIARQYTCYGIGNGTYKYTAQAVSPFDLDTTLRADQNTVPNINYNIGPQGPPGTPGQGVGGVEYLYAASTEQIQPQDSDFTSVIPVLDPVTNRYLWVKTIIYDTDQTVVSSNVSIGGVYGNTGSPGSSGTSITISSQEVKYQTSSSGTTPPTGEWSSSIPSVSQGDYLWTRTVVTYSDTSSTTAYSVSYIGEDGQAGSSVTISGRSVKYQASDSGIIVPSGTWSDSVPTVDQGQYLWTRTVVTYSTGQSTTAYSVGYIGTNGQTGSSVSISTQEIRYQKGTSGTTVPTGTWLVDVPSVDQGEYLWTRTVVNYTDGNSTTAYSVAYIGEDGQPGTSVSISSQVTEYQKSSSGTVTPTGQWSETVPSVDQGEYLWTRTTVNYSPSGQTISYSVSYMGQDGVGEKVTTTLEYALTSSSSVQPSTWYSTRPDGWIVGYCYWVREKYTTEGGTVSYGTAYVDTAYNEMMGQLASFTLTVTPSTYKRNLRTNNNQTITINVTKDYYDGNCTILATAKIDDSDVPMTVTTVTLNSKYTITVNDVNDFDKITITGTLTGAPTQTVVMNVVDETIYNKNWGSLTSLPADVILNGDYFFAESNFSDGTNDFQKGFPYVRENDSWSQLVGNTPENAERLLGTLSTVLSDEQTPNSLSAIYGWFQNLAAQTAVIQSLFSEAITILNPGYIQSENFAEQDGFVTQGFKLNASGLGQFGEGTQLGNVDIRINDSINGSPVQLLTTSKYAVGASYIVPSKTRWCTDDLFTTATRWSYCQSPRTDSPTVTYNGNNYYPMKGEMYFKPGETNDYVLRFDKACKVTLSIQSAEGGRGGYSDYLIINGQNKRYYEGANSTNENYRWSGTYDVPAGGSITVNTRNFPYMANADEKSDHGVRNLPFSIVVDGAKAVLCDRRVLGNGGIPTSNLPTAGTYNFTVFPSATYISNPLQFTHTYNGGGTTYSSNYIYYSNLSILSSLSNGNYSLDTSTSNINGVTVKSLTKNDTAVYITDVNDVTTTYSIAVDNTAFATNGWYQVTGRLILVGSQSSLITYNINASNANADIGATQKFNGIYANTFYGTHRGNVNGTTSGPYSDYSNYKVWGAVFN